MTTIIVKHPSENPPDPLNYFEEVGERVRKDLRKSRKNEIDLRNSFEMYGTKERKSEHLKFLKDHPEGCYKSIMRGYKVREDNGERCSSNLTVSIPISDKKLEEWIDYETFQDLLNDRFVKFDILTDLFYNPDLDEEWMREQKLTYKKIIDELEMGINCSHGFRFCWIPEFNSSHPVRYRDMTHNLLKSSMNKVRS